MIQFQLFIVSSNKFVLEYIKHLYQKTIFKPFLYTKMKHFY